MRKRLLVFLCMSMTAATIFTGCSTSKSAPESTTEEAKPKIISTKELLSASDYDIDDYVTLPDDVMELQISLSKSYTPTDAGAQEYIKNAISTYKNYTKTEKTIVENGDVHKI